MQLVEADCKIEDEIGVIRLCGIGSEIGLLRFAPALFAGIEIAQCEEQRRRIRLAGQRRFQAAFGLGRVALAARLDHAGLRCGVVGVRLKREKVIRVRARRIAPARGNGRESKQGIGALGVAAQELLVGALRDIELSGLHRVVGLFERQILFGLAAR